MNDGMKTILLLTCGTNACYHVSRILKEKFLGDFRVVGTDINHKWMIPTAHYLDAFYQSPYSCSNNYYSFILDVCKKEKVDYVLPSFDTDQQLFYNGNTDLASLGIRTFGIDESLREVYSNKSATIAFLKLHDLPVPKTYTYIDLVDSERYFVKPKHGVGSVGARVMTGKEILDNHDDEMLIQEICSGPEITLECFNYGGRICSVARLRIDCKSGVCTKTRIYQDSRLESVAQKFSSVAELPCIFNLQFMRNSKKEFVITDVNLRTAGGMSLSHAAGWDEVSALAKIMMNKPVEDVFSSLQLPAKEQYVIRAYTDIVTKVVKNRIAFDLDGTLLDSRERHEKLMQDILQEKDLDVDVSDILSYKAEGHNNKEWLTLKGIDTELTETINNEWINKIETETYLSFDKLYPDTLDNLVVLAENNSLFLLTARSNERAVREQLSTLGIAQFFEEICVVPSGKQSSVLKSQFLQQKSIDFMIGDTEVDYHAALDVHCKFRVCLNGFRSSNYWKKYDVIQFDINELK